MACLIAPLVEAIAVIAVKKVIENKELKAAGVEKKELTLTNESGKIRMSKKLGWLQNLLLGGVLLLILEHMWHGEIVPFPPFLTAMYNPADVPAMLTEIATVGVAMAILVTLVWGGMVVIADYKVKKATAQKNIAVKEEQK